MAIHFVSGKPGAGKSMLAVRRMLDDLRNSRRNIVTNLPLNLARLNEFLQQAWPNEDCAAIQRVRILTEDESRTFWKYRGPALSEAEPNGAAPFGVLYILDELHLFFGARDWAQTGKDCLHYLSQHRKIGDTVMAITQSVPNVDKQFRSVAQDFSVVRNEYTAKFGIFRGRGRFSWKSYLQEPSDGTNKVPFDEGAFTLDAAGVASCYDTAQGVGVQGTSADKGARAKGIPIWWAIPMMIGVGALCGIVPYALGKGASHYLTAGVSAKVVAAKTASTPATSPPGAVSIAATQSAMSVPKAGLTLSTSFDPAEAVWATGWAVHGTTINILLSDGRTIDEDSGLALVTRNRVQMKDGTVYHRMRSSPGAGAKGAPVRQDTAVPAVVSANVPTGIRSGADILPVAAGDSAQITSPPSSGNSGSWYTGQDGVQRLTVAPSLGR